MEEEDDDDVIITHQVFHSPTHTCVVLPNQPEKVPIVVETQTKWDNSSEKMQIMVEEIMRTKKLKGGQTIEEFMREQVEEKKQANHTLQE
jgi:hypothetical protein